MKTDPRNFAIKAHNNQAYGSEPYGVHLDAVVAVLRDAGITSPDILAIGYLHDVLEDTNTSEQDLRDDGFSEAVIRGVKFCTDEKGFSRKARKAITQSRARTNYDHFGAIVKMADRIANLESCRSATNSNPSLLAMYHKEARGFIWAYQWQGPDEVPGIPKASRDVIEARLAKVSVP